MLRGDIEGLRAIAVMMVLLYHAGLPGVSGGFAGVDVFFVISGYLITNQLVREASTNRRISLTRFYARRARRLLPAATLVLLTTTIAGWWLLPRGRHAELGIDVLAATGYVLNWSLAARQVDYLAEDAAPSLVQHYWSLSVEEQFYVLWPLLIIAVLWATHRYRLRLLPMLALALTLVVATSLAWSVTSTASSPQTAYFVTTTRVWQLGTGALLVLATPLLARLPRPAAATAAWAGLALIATTLFTTTTATPWPGTAALLPTLGTAAVIAGGATWPTNPAARLLSHRPMLFLGAISYGLYLWHWPALRLLAETHPDATLPTRLAVAAASILAAWATLHLVENPIRHHPALTTDHRRTLLLGATAMALTATTATTLWATAPTLDTQQVPVEQVGAITLVDPLSRTDDDLRLVADWRATTAVVDQLVPDPAVADEDLSVAYRDGCQVNTEGTELKDDEVCWFGDPDGTVTVALVGDSKMEQWSSALHAVGLQEGWRIRGYTKSACGFVTEGRSESCHSYNRVLAERLTEDEHTPDLIFTSLGSGYDPEMVDSALSLLEPVLDRGAQVVVLADNPGPRPQGMPEGTSVYQCLDVHRDDYGPCWATLTSSGNPTLTELADRLEAPLVDLNRWVCPDPGEPQGCPPVVGGTVVYRQGSHLSGSYVRSLTPVLHHELVVADVATTPLDQIRWTVPQDPPPRG
ncbi:hypothetical protein BJF81_08450 [Ornithinimicrobium sp. CNJ-824]|uniref:acyltransferase family protein n=2 Tax=Ornithinimicrobium sp. CNJ-824 TaxID=1904966 RepID=UPI0009680D3C|nr:acyltransferase family protein [Ornithinimicrobium sp. CNJ-824]OLT19544.1 hypothetical protein BJF81_08450 [Ornithinimicrobium sp. CNJ-824]